LDDGQRIIPPFEKYEIFENITSQPAITITMQSIIALVSLAFSLTTTRTTTTTTTTTALDCTLQYQQARWIRAQHGHNAAQPLYQKLQQNNRWDRSAATYLASLDQYHHDHACQCLDLELISQLRDKLQTYTNQAVQSLFQIPSYYSSNCAAVQVKSVEAGSDTYPPLPTTSAECWATLFLLGITLPLKIVQQCLGPDIMSLWQALGLAILNDNQMVVPLVQLVPLEVDPHTTLFLVTDWHPRVLGSTQAGSHDAVMYIGPDSLALVQHFGLQIQLTEGNNILDLCTGSGIQSIVLLKRNFCSRAVCVDLNPRALQFCRFNAILNNVSERLETVEGDLLDELDLGDVKFDLITANPPFIPVPSQDTQVSKRYGLYSAGGSDGTLHLQAILRLAETRLQPMGILAVVSEFMNPQKALTEEWFGLEGRRGLFLTNEYPVLAETYAARRADSLDEEQVWLQHLTDLGITKVSPGLLFVQQAVGTMQHRIVPKSRLGSLWTPSNQDAVAFTKESLEQVFGLM
jgi:methylase of polypeptide subunit release factors